MTRERDGRAGVDLALLVSVCVLAAAASIYFEAADRASDLVRDWGPLDLNGILAVAILVPLATSVYAVRRYRDAMRVREELARLSLRDDLTGLPNRMFLGEWLDGQVRAAHREGQALGVLFVDLDRFKMVNDTHGHDVGDAVLVALAGRLQQCLDDVPGGRAVRYAGDEFLVVCREDELRPLADRLARRVLAALDEPFAIGADTLRVSASVGVALSQPHDTGEDLVRRADAAMYDAKARDDGRPVHFDESVHGARFSPATLEPHLRRAAEEGAFRLAYQPVADAATGQIVAVETLLRWDHPERGPVPPSEFIPVLEDSGLIVPVGAWIIEEAIGQALVWQQAYPDRPPLRVTINVSARQLAQTGFDEHVRAVLARTPVPPASICLEITEGALMVDIDAAWSSLRLLKRMGVKLALDDFGTGYSSLSYIRSFSLDMLKIDRSFVKGLGQSSEDTAIVEHVVGMARALGMVTVGEGVETPLQMAELHRLGCELVQGFLLSKPVTAEQIDDILSRGGFLARGEAPRAAAVADGAPPRRPAGSSGLFAPAPPRRDPSPPAPDVGHAPAVATGAPAAAAER
ncbi:bifunctional diguanylate cyclase/phosphodiesterase [Iamia majanohamensis]|uniref:Bifunctional diguanylate cyclase/phosphodiesterase n=1 Tax=Iamia majanohamensis TaxID=467976 RepID=A0AAE9Y6G3_9ACTN|nr:bifunctional diguanylate cyclase/phosphodiesterase [Iamia majanohamensis]WCO65084.1 bifunctional diguanylate cyclase/phosphodiesterase [Iamia majanohamensis]